MQHAVYRLFAKDGTLLYVGRSKDPFVRFYQHITRQPWMADIDHHTAEWHPDFETAALAERIAVLNEHPLHNKHYAPMTICPKCGGEKEWGPSYCRKCKSAFNKAYRKKVALKKRGLTIS